MIEWAYFFPRNQQVIPLGKKVVQVFENVALKIDSQSNNEKIGKEFKDARSDAVLSHVRAGLEAIGFRREDIRPSAVRPRWKVRADI